MNATSLLRNVLTLAMLLLLTLTTAAQPPAPVVVTRVVEQQMTSGQTFVGTVTASRRSVVESAVDGRVVVVNVDDGDPVKMTKSKDGEARLVGQPLVQLFTRTLEIEIAAAQAELDLRSQALQELQAALPEQVKQASAALAEADALLKYAELRYDRLESLAKTSQSVSQEQLDESFSRLTAARQIQIKATSAAAQLNDTRAAKLAQAHFKVEVQKEEVRRLNDVKSKYTIRAPFDGFVVRTHTEVGEWLSQGEPVVEIVALDPIEVTVAVPEQYIAPLSESLEAKQRGGDKLAADIRVNSLPDKLFSGEVLRVVPDADLRSRTFPVRIQIANPAHALKPGMLAKVALAVGREQTAMLVPKDALVLGGKTPSVFVVESKDKATTVRSVNVETGVSIGSLIEVRGGLKSGDRIVLVGNERLRGGQAVQVTKEVPAE